VFSTFMLATMAGSALLRLITAYTSVSLETALAFVALVTRYVTLYTMHSHW
jgi:hypothetical protein